VHSLVNKNFDNIKMQGMYVKKIKKRWWQFISVKRRQKSTPTMCRKLESHIKNIHHDDRHKPCNRSLGILLHVLVTFVNLQTYTLRDCVVPVVITLFVSLI